MAGREDEMPRLRNDRTMRSQERPPVELQTTQARHHPRRSPHSAASLGLLSSGATLGAMLPTKSQVGCWLGPTATRRRQCLSVVPRAGRHIQVLLPESGGAKQRRPALGRQVRLDRTVAAFPRREAAASGVYRRKARPAQEGETASLWLSSLEWAVRYLPCDFLLLELPTRVSPGKPSEERGGPPHIHVLRYRRVESKARHSFYEMRSAEYCSCAWLSYGLQLKAAA